MAGAQACRSLLDAQVQLVLVSGRTQAQTMEVARVVSASAYIAELGAIVVVREPSHGERIVRNFGTYRGEQSPFDAMARAGAGAFLFEAFRGALEPHTPWSSNAREATMLMRGYAPAATQALADAGYGWLTLLDNGIIPRTFPGLDVPEVHAYHLVPAGVSKAAGVRTHRELSGLAPEETAAIGDSPSDLELAREVGQMFIVANGRAAVDEQMASYPNARYTEGSHGEGVRDAVRLLLGGQD